MVYDLFEGDDTITPENYNSDIDEDPTIMAYYNSLYLMLVERQKNGKFIWMILMISI